MIIIALWIESHNIEDFSRALELTRNDLHNLRLIFVGVEQGDLGILSAIGVKVSPHIIVDCIRITLIIYRIPSSETWSSSSRNF